MSPRIHAEAEKLVRERKASSYSVACSMISKRRNKPKQSKTPDREIRLPYRDD